MAKQTIGVGLVANDGSGDPLRSAFIKVNENFTELYNGQFDGNYSSLSGTPAIPSKLTDLGIVDGASGQALTTDGNGNFTFATITGGGGGGIALTDLSVTVATAGAANLAYNNGTGVFTYTPPDLSAYQTTALAFSGDYADLINKPTIPAAFTTADVDTHLNQSNPTDGYVLSWTSGDYAWVAPGGGGGSSLQTRTTKTVTATSLGAGSVSNSDIDGFKSFGLMSIETSHAAWVRLYISSAARTADASRLETTDPLPDAGVIAEVITTGAETVNFGPAVLGWLTSGTTISAAITNKSGATNNVQVTLTLLQLEA